MAAGADGLMIEVHDAPEQALSDGLASAPSPLSSSELVEQLRALAPASSDRAVPSYVGCACRPPGDDLIAHRWSDRWLAGASSSRRSWCSKTARSSRARAAASGHAVRRSGLQHLDDRLSGDPHRPVLPRPDRGHDPRRTSATTASAPRSQESERPWVEGFVARQFTQLAFEPRQRGGSALTTCGLSRCRRSMASTRGPSSGGSGSRARCAVS